MSLDNRPQSVRTHLAGDAPPRGAQGHPDGELATAADDPLGHRAEDAETDEYEPGNRKRGRHLQQEPANRDAFRQHVLEHAHVAHGKQRVHTAHGLAHRSEGRGGIGSTARDHCYVLRRELPVREVRDETGVDIEPADATTGAPVSRAVPSLRRTSTASIKGSAAGDASMSSVRSIRGV